MLAVYCSLPSTARAAAISNLQLVLPGTVCTGCCADGLHEAFAVTYYSPVSRCFRTAALRGSSRRLMSPNAVIHAQRLQAPTRLRINSRIAPQ